ncbi:hypothetical protein HOLleu_36018 [Holothuria leucospilota]|uniref:Uncharacterized protein n=1 Tax=Holothuria leucospilota TaxID=206669 RepID=A0A9Q0YQQ0_HOLLE|nr:hypothetical protein HOLleu_36018 [Holothuria leucospilota]
MKVLYLLTVLLVVGVMVSNNHVAGDCTKPDCYKCIGTECEQCVGVTATQCDSHQTCIDNCKK